MSIRKPNIKKPRIPKIKKPLTSKRKHIIKKLPTPGRRNIVQKTPGLKSHTKKKTTHKVILGTCYINKNCKGVLSRKVTRINCIKIGGKSWKKIESICKNL